MTEPTCNRTPEMEVCICDLMEQQLSVEIREAVKALDSFGIVQVRVECFDGYGSVAIEEIPAILSGEIGANRLHSWNGNVRPIDTTFFAKELEIEFCHHDGVHVRSDDERFLNPFLRRWHNLGLLFRKRRGDNWELPRRAT